MNMSDLMAMVVEDGGEIVTVGSLRGGAVLFFRYRTQNSLDLLEYRSQDASEGT